MLAYKQTAAALAVLALAAGGPKSALANGAVKTATATTAQAFATRAYWTPERLGSATPLDMTAAIAFRPSSGSGDSLQAIVGIRSVYGPDYDRSGRPADHPV
jgi:hypothetical protein